MLSISYGAQSLNKYADGHPYGVALLSSVSAAKLNLQ